MKNCTFYSVRKRRKENTLRRCAAMRAAKERKRLQNIEQTAQWEIVRILAVDDPRSGITHRWEISAAPDGRTVALNINGTRYLCCSERKIRAILARKLWSQTP